MERNADRKTIYERYRMLCSFVASVLLHCAFLAVVYYSSTSYPVVAMSSTHDVFWFYPSLLFGSPTASDEGADQGGASLPVPAARVSPHWSIPAGQASAAGDSGQDEIPVRLAGMSFGTTLVQPVEEESPAEFSALPVPALPPSKTSAKPEKPAHDVRKTVVASPKPSVTHNQPPFKIAGAPPVVKPRLVEPPLPAKSAMAETGAGGSAAGPRFSAVSSVKATHGKGAEVRKVTVTSTAASGTAGSPKAPLASPAQGALYVSGGGGASKQEGAPVAARELPRPAAPVTAKSVERKTPGVPAKAKGLFAPPLTGDIKFELVAREDVGRGVQVAVSFRDYPKSKRGRALSRSEAKRVRALHPKIVMPKENTIHAVIDHAAEGVYYLRVELQRDRISDASIKISLFEGSSRAKNITVHIRSLTGNETVVRLMMPEGIVWEDSSAFTGSLEDSDSETKFNADMGLEWKEYK